MTQQLVASRASERNFSRGYEDRCRAPKIRRGAKKKSLFKFGPIFCPKLGEEQKKGFHSILVPLSNLVQNLTRQPELFRPPPRPGYDVPPEPPSRRPWLPVISQRIEKTSKENTGADRNRKEGTNFFCYD